MFYISYFRLVVGYRIGIGFFAIQFDLINIGSVMGFFRPYRIGIEYRPDIQHYCTAQTVKKMTTAGKE